MIPILGTLAKVIPLKKVGEALLKVAGIGNGKATDTGIAALAVGIAGAQATGTDPFESAKMLIDLGQQAWPHILIVFGALSALAGWFRKAGKATPKP
jgi:hypothetical protein